MGRLARRLGLGLLAVLLLAAVAVVLGMLVPRAVAALGSQEPRHRVLVLSSLIHTDLAVPVDEAVRARFAFLAEAGLAIDRPEVGALVLGWGGRGFYLETPTWADLKPGPVLKALTLDDAVLHVGLGGAIESAGEGARALDLDEAGFERLLRFVEATLKRDGEGRPIAIAGAGYGPFDAFFEAKGPFNALLGCNDWTGRALAKAGVGVGLFTPLPAFLLWSLDLHG